MTKQRTLWALIAATCILVAGQVQAQPLVPICDIRVDANGDCITDALDENVCIQGVVIAWKQFGVRGAGAIWDSDSDCAISIFDITDAPDVPIGNLVEVCGWVGNFAGLAEIVDNPADGSMDPTVVDLGPGPAFPVIDLRANELWDFSPLAEVKESFLVRLCGQFTATGDFVGNTNYEFMDPFGDICTVRIDTDTDLVGTPIPVGPTEVYGVLGQFNNFEDICIGYQVLPRFVNDISAGDCETIATDVESWGAVKDHYRSN